MKQLCILLAVTIILFSCKKQKPSHEQSFTPVALSYAEGFSIKKFGTGILVEVLTPYQGATKGIRYFLQTQSGDLPQGLTDVKRIHVPINTIVCTSTTHIPMLDYLGETNALVGFPTLDYISSEKMRARIDSGNVMELGIDKGMNLELIASLHPDLVMAYAMSGDFGQFKKISELGTPVVLNSEYLERHPLGRAEWIKFVALFFNKEKEADSIFSIIEKEYLATQALVDTVSHKPTVMSGIVYGDAWFMPGGQNYAARLFRDAGFHYLWDDDPSYGYLQLSLEAAYAKAADADYWIGVGSYKSLQEIEDADQRYAKFKPFINHTVYSYEARIGAKGGNEFLELGYLRPDIILKDLVKIAHPELEPDYSLYFHKKITE